MQLPPLRPIKTNPHGFAEVPIEQEEEDQEPNFDIPQSREEKPAAYPNGPICIYESGVYLYFEPTADQAANYDVIMNVASEVKNPFTTPTSGSQEDLDARRKDGPPAENVDFAAIPEHTKDRQNSSPTTPKATPILESSQQPEVQSNGTHVKRPEYIHIPWEHNTDIVPDLYRLVKVIEDRVSQGKRVLVHCQCGVSRSASLIVAYGLYKNPGISVQEAYDAVKKRSKWIGPNMNLIMQLQEFRNGLLRANENNRSLHNQYGLNLPRKSAGLPSAVSSGNARHSPFEMDASLDPRTPHTAPLPPDSSDVTMQRASTGNMMALSPGPLSAPSGVFFSPGFRRSWASSQTHFDLSPKPSPISATPFVDPMGHVVPVLSVTNSDKANATESKPSEQDAGAQDQPQLKPLPVPNFSRPVMNFGNEETSVAQEATRSPSPVPERFLLAPLQPEGFGALRSPAKSSFDLVTSAPEDPYPTITTLMSPRTFEFPAHIRDPPSPKSSEPAQRHSFWRRDGPEELDILSPTASGFPKDIFPADDDSSSEGLVSPRAEEFHMTPLRPRMDDDDDFGLASPRRFEFPKNPFENIAPTPPSSFKSQGPAVQAILPPAHLDQTEGFGGFGSLNGSAHAGPAQPLPILDLPAPSAPRIDSLSTPISDPHTPDLPIGELSVGNHDTPLKSPEEPVQDSKTSEKPFLSTPSKPSIRTRFSSPNMREQRKLHKLQTEMEALLPPKSPQQLHSQDDIDALMSPRANEFTRNPFHMDLSSPIDEPSPVSSNETIKDGGGRDWNQSLQWTTPPRAISEDPRSPVQTGSSPIVRNIWDVL